MTPEQEAALRAYDASRVGLSEPATSQTLTPEQQQALANYERQNGPVSFWRDLVGRQALGQGLAMGFGDEIEAGVRTGAGLYGNYGETLQGIRDSNRNTERVNPVGAAAAQFVGGVVPAVGAGVAALATGGAAAPAAAGLGARTLAAGGRAIASGDRIINAALSPVQRALLRAMPNSPVSRGAVAGAATGATYGGIQGVGQGEGEGRVASGATGALVGAGLGGPLGAVGSVAAPAAARFFASPEQRAAMLINDFSSRAGAGASFNDIVQDYRRLEEAARGIGHVRQVTGGEAIPIVPPITLAEVGRNNPLRGQLDSLLTTPTRGEGRARENLTSRLQGDQGGANSQGERVLSYMRSAFGLNTTSRSAQTQRLTDLRNLEASVFDAVRQQPVTRSPGLDAEIAALPRNVLRYADEIATARGIGGNPSSLVREGRLTRNPSAEELVALQQGLRAHIDSQFAAGNSPVATANKERLRELERLLDGAIPGFREARGTYAQNSAAIRAAEAGQAAGRDPSITTDAVERALADMPVAERRLYAEGFLANFRDRVMASLDTEATAAYRGLSSEQASKIRAIMTSLYGDEGPRRTVHLLRLLEAEGQISRNTQRVLASSPTHERSMATRAREFVTNPFGGLATGGYLAAVPIAATVGGAAGGGAAGAAATAHLIRNLWQRRGEHTSGAMLNLLSRHGGSGLLQSPGAVNNTIDRIQQNVYDQMMRQRAASMPGTGTGRAVSTPYGLLADD